MRHKIRLLTLLKRTRSGRLEATGPAAAAAAPAKQQLPEELGRGGEREREGEE